MYRQSSVSLRAVFAVATLVGLANSSWAQTGYGVDANHQLFRFDVDSPATVTPIGGPLSFLPEGIDFRPSSTTLFAIDVGAVSTQLYTIDIVSGVATAVGAGFGSTGTVNATPYDLTTSTNFGFDFNPTTLQADSSMRIRLVNTAGVNMRLNSATGAAVAVDMPLRMGTDAQVVDGAAYINNFATMGGATTLFDLDTRDDVVFTQVPPNDGTLNLVGSFGFDNDAQGPTHFDVFTQFGSVDPTIGGDRGLAVLRRPGTPPTGPVPAGSYLLYDVNLATGALTMGRAVGPPATPVDFSGGFAVLPAPEPASLVMVLIGLTGSTFGRWRRN